MVEAWDGRSAPELLALERLDRDLFRNRFNQRNANDALFGGQVLAQALTAATHTVAAERLVHSLHGYFLRAGRAGSAVIYAVDRTRDGGRFSTRRVIAIQEGEPIFHMECGFHGPEEGFHHQEPLPGDVPPPEALPDLPALAEAWADRLPAWLRDRWRAPERPVEVKPVEPEQFLAAPARPRRRMWVRLPSGAAAATPAEHACLLA